MKVTPQIEQIRLIVGIAPLLNEMDELHRWRQIAGFDVSPVIGEDLVIRRAQEVAAFVRDLDQGLVEGFGDRAHDAAHDESAILVGQHVVAGLQRADGDRTGRRADRGVAGEAFVIDVQVDLAGVALLDAPGERVAARAVLGRAGDRPAGRPAEAAAPPRRRRGPRLVEDLAAALAAPAGVDDRRRGDRHRLAARRAARRPDPAGLGVDDEPPGERRALEAVQLAGRARQDQAPQARRAVGHRPIEVADRLEDRGAHARHGQLQLALPLLDQVRRAADHHAEASGRPRPLPHGVGDRAGHVGVR
jgi:hypothetical protein